MLIPDAACQAQAVRKTHNTGRKTGQHAPIGATGLYDTNPKRRREVHRVLWIVSARPRRVRVARGQHSRAGNVWWRLGGLESECALWGASCGHTAVLAGGGAGGQ